MVGASREVAAINVAAINVAAIILAAGRGTRFDPAPDESKVFAPLGGVPLVRRVVETALASRAGATLVITGHAHAKVTDALAGLPVTFAHNPDFATGMASSLKRGIAALAPETAGALILLADMPRVAVSTLDALIEAARASVASDAIIPVYDGKQGNPVLLRPALFGEIARLAGDQGARKLLAEPGRALTLCPIDDPGILIDVDTRDALRTLEDQTARLSQS